MREGDNSHPPSCYRSCSYDFIRTEAVFACCSRNPGKYSAITFRKFLFFQGFRILANLLVHVGYMRSQPANHKLIRINDD